MTAYTVRQRIARRLAHAVSATEDPTGIRRLLRNRLAHPAAGIVAAALVIAAALRMGDSPLYLALAALAVGQLVVDRLLGGLGHPIAPDRRYEIILVAWPLGFLALGLAGWSPDGSTYYGDAVARVALVAAGFIGFASPLSVAAAWGAVSATALLLGTMVLGPIGPQALLPVAAIGIGTACAASIRTVIESFLDSRRQALTEMMRVAPSADPFVTARALVEPLVALPGLRNVGLIWFTSDDQSVMLALGGEALTAAVASGRTMPAARNRTFRDRAAAGAWITGWDVRTDDDAYTHDLAARGVDAVAYVPLAYEGMLLGVLAASLDEASGGISVLTEQLPILVEAAALSSAALGPSLAALTGRTAAAKELDAIIREHRYWPVFQPIRDLATQRIVGYEALSRFDTAAGTERLFAQAAALGRLRDLEAATLAAITAAEPDLPRGVWLSVNASADLLAGGEELDRLVASIRRPLVIELSEHEAIDDYGPILAAMRRLGPHCSLAVDDAGAGFASLRHILEVKPAYVKLDIGLISGVDADPSRRALIAGFVHFARDAGFMLVAEGIETPEELACLRTLGVQFGQGYLLGRPSRVTELPTVQALAS
jgi:EAL domain-containing protein (putative c-di-GMP-specific phosphodiesterase class I)